MKKLMILIVLELIVLCSLKIVVKASNIQYSEGNITVDLIDHDGNFDGTVENGYTVYDPFNTNTNQYNPIFHLNTRLREYNCHYFTFFVSVNSRFYSNNLNGELYWFYQPEEFIENNLYIETDRYNAEIIVYYDEDDKIIHSGRVCEVYDGTPFGNLGDANLVEVISKWDVGFVYYHNGNESYYAEEAAYVKYYKYYNSNLLTGYDSTIGKHTSFSSSSYSSFITTKLPHLKVVESNNYNNTEHGIHCMFNDCNYPTSESHSICYAKHNESLHRKYCSSCNYSIYESHNYVKINDLYYKCNLCHQFAHFIPIIHDGFNPAIPLLNTYPIVIVDGQMYYVVLMN
ncbi:MAG: hypothetical protein J6X93_06780 [Bacilli bacterium]|nr:hypothetical protein [Bacilli bacterium]